jgi:cytochrome c553
MKKPSLFAILSLACGAAGAVEGNAEAARAKVSMCIGCHGIAGYRATFPQVFMVPKIGGQQPAYIAKALQAYKSGGRNHPTMRSIASGLSEQDMADVAVYYGGGK